MNKSTDDRRQAEARNEEGYLEALSIKYQYEEACRRLKACQNGNSPFFVHEDRRWIVYHEKLLPFKEHNKILESRVIHLSGENKRLSLMNAQLLSMYKETSMAVRRLDSEKSELESTISHITLEKERQSNIIASMKKTTKVVSPRLILTFDRIVRYARLLDPQTSFPGQITWRNMKFATNVPQTGLKSKLCNME